MPREKQRRMLKGKQRVRTHTLEGGEHGKAKAKHCRVCTEMSLQALIVTYKKSTHLGIHSEKILSRSTRRLCEVVHQGVLRLQRIETLSEAVTLICHLYSLVNLAPVKKK